MANQDFAISPRTLAGLVGTPGAPWIVDVRRREAFDSEERIVAGAIWRDHAQAATWATDLPPGPVVVYCVHGHQVSQAAAALLRGAGREACHLAGGIEDYMSAGGPNLRKAAVPEATLAGAGRWLSAFPPSIDSLACAWLIRRLVDPAGPIHLAEPEWAETAAGEIGAAPFALNGSPALQELLADLDLKDPALAALAEDVAGRSELAPGLAAIIGGLERLCETGDRLITAALPLFDGLYARRRPAP